MTTGRIVGTEAAVRAAQQVQSVLAGGLEQRVQALAESLRMLSNPDVWDGPQAAEFRAQAPRRQAGMAATVQSVRRLGLHAEQVMRSIMNAGSQGTLSTVSATQLAAPNAPLVTGVDLPAPGTSPGRVHSWWNSLTPEQQQYYESEDAVQLGALDGIPVDVRDKLNRSLVDFHVRGLSQQITQLDQQQVQLYRKRDDLRQTLNDLQDGVDPNAKQERQQLQAELTDTNNRITANQQQIQADTDYLSGIGTIQTRLRNDQPPAYLLGLDTQGSTGHFILAINNPDHARNVATIVPGVNNSLKDPQWGVRAADQIVQQAGQGGSTSAVVWLNYSPPQGPVPWVDVATAGQTGAAKDGAPAFDRFEQGLEVTNDHSIGSGDLGPHLTVIGHSYGSVLVGEASKGPAGTLPVQDVIAIASPGMDVRDASAFGPGTHVWAGTAQGDPISAAERGAGGFGYTPIDAEFGASVFNADLTGPASDVDVHNSYFDNGSNALANMADIVTGNYDAVQSALPVENYPRE